MANYACLFVAIFCIKLLFLKLNTKEFVILMFAFEKNFRGMWNLAKISGKNETEI